MLGNARRGEAIIRHGKLERPGPAEEDAVPRDRTATARRAFAHDSALVNALFGDLTLWREESGERVRYLSVRALGGNDAALRTAITAIFDDIGLLPSHYSIQAIDERQREMPRGQLAVAIPSAVLSQCSARMKWLLSEIQHSAEVQR
jgi:hypothetical protein